MLAVTVQRYDHLVDREYRPSFLRSHFVSETGEFLENYHVMLDKLSQQTDQKYIFGVDSCYWLWVDNPFFDFHSWRAGNYYVCILNIPDSAVVLSDYDKWTNCNNVGSTNIINCFVDSSAIGKGNCIQGVTWNLDWFSVLCICPLRRVVDIKFSTIQDLLNQSMQFNEFSRVTAERLGLLPIRKPSVPTHVFDNKLSAIAEFYCSSAASALRKRSEMIFSSN